MDIYKYHLRKESKMGLTLFHNGALRDKMWVGRKEGTLQSREEYLYWQTLYYCWMLHCHLYGITLDKHCHIYDITVDMYSYCFCIWVQNSGLIAPLDEIVRLKEKFRFRVIMDESHSLGVLGNSGRGLAEHYGVPVCLTSIFVYLFPCF